MAARRPPGPADAGQRRRGSHELSDVRTETLTLYAKEHRGGAYRLVVTSEGQRFESGFTIR